MRTTAVSILCLFGLVFPGGLFGQIAFDDATAAAGIDFVVEYGDEFDELVDLDHAQQYLVRG